MTEKAPQNIPEKPHQPSSSQAIYPQGCQEPEPNEMPPLDDTICFEDGKHPLPIWARGLLLLGMIGLLVFGVVTLMQEKTTTSMNIKHLNKPQQSEISRISVTTSPAYQAKLETYGQRKAEEARRSGATYIAPIAEARQRAPSTPQKAAPVQTPMTEDAKPKPSPKQDLRSAQKEPAKAPRAEKIIDAKRLQLKTQALQSCFAEPDFVPQKVQIFREPKPLARQQHAPLPTEAPLLHPGDFLYATNLLHVTSDSPGPVMAQLISGKLKGAKLLGSFTRHKEHLLLTFTRLILPEKASGTPRERTLLAYAVDPKKHATALASNVDHHYFRRFAGLLGASFLAGFGNAIQKSGVANYHSAYGNSSYTPHYDLNEQLWIAAGSLGQEAAQIFREHAREEITVSLDAGIDLGILVVKADTQASLK